MIVSDIKDAREGDVVTIKWGPTTLTGPLFAEVLGGATPNLALQGPDGLHLLRVATFDGTPCGGVEILSIERALPVVDGALFRDGDSDLWYGVDSKRVTLLRDLEAGREVEATLYEAAERLYGPLEVVA